MRIDFDGEAGPDESEALRRARAFHRGESDAPGPLPDEIARPLVDALVARTDVARLQALAGGAATDKATAKLARRGLHLLRTRGHGVDVPRHVERPRAPTRTDEDALPSLVSAAVRDGERLAWLVRLDPAGQVEIYQAEVRETLGMTRFEGIRSTRRGWRDLGREFLANDELPVVAAPRAYVRRIMEDGAQLAQSLGRSVPREFVEARHLLDAPTVIERHPALDAVPAEAIARARGEAHRFVDILRLPEAGGWMPDEDVARRALAALDELAYSLVIVDERQRLEQAHETLRRMAVETLAVELPAGSGRSWRRRLVERLLHTAFVVAARAAHGPRGRDYVGEAALCIAASEQLADAAVADADLLLPQRLFERLFDLWRLHRATSGAPEPAPPTPGGLIVEK